MIVASSLNTPAQLNNYVEYYADADHHGVKRAGYVPLDFDDPCQAEQRRTATEFMRLNAGRWYDV